MREAVVIDVSQQGRRGRASPPTTSSAPASSPAPGQIAVIKTLWTDRAFGKPEFWNNTIHLEPSVGEWRRARCLRRGDGLLSREAVLAHDAHAGRTRRQSQALAQGRHPDDPDAHQARPSIAAHFTLIALPLKLQGMDGAPARVIGIEP